MRLVSKELLAALRTRVCSVGVWKNAEFLSLEDTSSSPMKIFGTGFLVSKLVVLTNRHVVENMNAYLKKERLPRECRHVSFLHPRGHEMVQTYLAVTEAVCIEEPRHADLGLLLIGAGPDHWIQDLSPLELAADFETSVGDAVAVYGYAFGEELLIHKPAEDDKLYRCEPLLQHGYVSGIAPYEHAPNPFRVLLDVRTAAGMSGAPVVAVATGKVCAIHNAGRGSTVAFAVPLSAGRVSACVDHCLEGLNKGAVEGTFRSPNIQRARAASVESLSELYARLRIEHERFRNVNTPAARGEKDIISTDSAHECGRRFFELANQFQNQLRQEPLNVRDAIGAHLASSRAASMADDYCAFYRTRRPSGNIVRVNQTTCTEPPLSWAKATVTTVDGTTIDGFMLATEFIRDWDSFFETHSILEEKDS